jgi:hypothetical protein
MRSSTAHNRSPGASLTFVAALAVWFVLLAPDATRVVSPAAAQPRQPATTERAVRSDDRSNGRMAGANERGADVVFEDYPLNSTELGALRQGDRIVLTHPDGGSIDLHVVRIDSTPQRRHLLLMHGALASTFTESNGTFFGTLATPRGVYALEGNALRSRLTRHALLDLRMNPHAPDYRSYPPG